MGARLINYISTLLCCLLFACNNDDSEPIGSPALLGEWQVVAIHNSSPSGPTMAPGPGEIISIVFAQNESFTGNTSANTFGGKFSVSGSMLIIGEMFTTEAADTTFGQAFYETFNESRNPETGFSEFELSFQDENRLDLEYQDFKFLSLEKQ